MQCHTLSELERLEKLRFTTNYRGALLALVMNAPPKKELAHKAGRMTYTSDLTTKQYLEAIADYLADRISEKDMWAVLSRAGTGRYLI